MNSPHNVLPFGRSYQEELRKQQDCQQEAKPDPNDIIMQDAMMLVKKSDSLIGEEQTNQTLPGRIDLVLAARRRKP